MKHLDPDISALVALGERPERASVHEHLAVCDECRREVDALRETVMVARSSLGEAELQTPPAHVWEGIRRDLSLPSELTEVAVPDRDTTADATSGPDRGSRIHGSAPVAILSDARARRADRLRRFVAPVVASAAAAALVVGAALSWNAAAPRVSEQLLASAQLDALPAWQGSTGSAEVAQLDDGDRILRVSVAASARGDGVREVWLLTPEVDGLISLGLLDGTSGEFTIPASVDLDRYSVVDISLEPLDGDPTHSGDSIVRGPLGA